MILMTRLNLAGSSTARGVLIAALSVLPLFVISGQVIVQSSQNRTESRARMPGRFVHERVRQYLAEGWEESEGTRGLFVIGDEAVPSL